jgi:hypothetical protein
MGLVAEFAKRHGLGGFPSDKLPELQYATWQWFQMDDAKANSSDDVRHALAEFISCFIDAGPAYTPDDRLCLERFFGSVAATLSSRLPGYTGSHARFMAACSRRLAAAAVPPVHTALMRR